MQIMVHWMVRQERHCCHQKPKQSSKSSTIDTIKGRINGYDAGTRKLFFYEPLGAQNQLVMRLGGCCCSICFNGIPQEPTNKSVGIGNNNVAIPIQSCRVRRGQNVDLMTCGLPNVFTNVKFKQGGPEEIRNKSLKWTTYKHSWVNQAQTHNDQYSRNIPQQHQ